MEAYVLATLATIGISFSIAYSIGPYGIFYLLRERYELFGCIPCLSFYVSLLVVAVFTIHIGILGWLAVWGAVTVSDRFINAIMR